MRGRAAAGAGTIAGLLFLGACGQEAVKPDAAGSPSGPVAAAPPASTASTSSNPLLASQAVQDAIHRALTTGENQRWQDGELSGYAVPGLTVQANGCRTVRYTVDQRPDEPMMTINACDASRK